MTKRDPNKFRIDKDCKGCDRVFDELTRQDDILARLRAHLEASEVAFDEEGERHNKIAEHWDNEALTAQEAGGEPEAMRLRAMADAARLLGNEMAATAKKLRGK